MEKSGECLNSLGEKVDSYTLFSLKKNLSHSTKELKFSLRARSNNPLFLVLEVSFIYSDKTPVRERPFVFLYSNS